MPSTYDKSASKYRKPRGFFAATVTRVDGDDVYVIVPHLSADFEHGPVPYDGSLPAEGDSAFVSFLDGDPDYPMVLFPGGAGEREGPIDITFVIAANDAPDHIKAVADYVCDGVADQEQFIAALGAVDWVDGVRLRLAGYYFVFDDVLNIGDATLGFYPPYVSIVGDPHRDWTLIYAEDVGAGELGLIHSQYGHLYLENLSIYNDNLTVGEAPEALIYDISGVTIIHCQLWCENFTGTAVGGSIGVFGNFMWIDRSRVVAGKAGVKQDYHSSSSYPSTIKGSAIECRGDDWAIQYSSEMNVYGCEIDQNDDENGSAPYNGGGIGVIPGGWPQNVYIANNEIIADVHPVQVVGDGVFFGYNHVSDGGGQYPPNWDYGDSRQGYMIWVNSQYSSIVDNIIYGSSVGIWMRHTVDHLSITGNVMYGGMHGGIYSEPSGVSAASYNLIISKNQFIKVPSTTSLTFPAINLNDVNKLVLTDNLIVDSVFYEAIYLERCEQFVIAGNVIGLWFYEPQRDHYTPYV